MFLTYLRRELRRRARQAVLIALGLALGIGLVITVAAASDGVKNAQSQVLHSLYGVGTDITVTRPAAAGSGGFGRFGFGIRFSGGGGAARPAAGTKISINRLTSGQLDSLSAASVTSVARLTEVAAAAGGLTLTDTAITGTVPNFTGSGGFGGGGGTGGSGAGGSGAGGSGGGVTGRGSFAPTFFSVTGVDLSTGALGPLSSGKLAAGRTFATSDASSDVALVDVNYAANNKLKVGGTIEVGNAAGKATSFTIVGLVSTPSGTASDVYIPLGRAQALAGLTSKVNTIYVAADNSTVINSVASAISKQLPNATVTTPSSLASQVTGSLASASSLASRLGKWLAIAVLIAAFALAALLTMSAVSRRVREFGTLKALGWRSRRVVGQVMGEALLIGALGGLIGVGLGYLGASIIGQVAGPLTATVGASTGSATPGGARVFQGGGFPGAGGAAGGGTPGRFAALRQAGAPTVTVHLNAPVTIGVIAAAVLLAVLGGLIAGGFGSWRAARLRPAAAMARIA